MNKYLIISLIALSIFLVGCSNLSACKSLPNELRIISDDNGKFFEIEFPNGFIIKAQTPVTIPVSAGSTGDIIKIRTGMDEQEVKLKCKDIQTVKLE